MQKPRFAGCLSEALDDERFIRMRGATDHVHAPRLHLEQERHVLRDQTAGGPDSVVKKSAATSAGQCA